MWIFERVKRILKALRPNHDQHITFKIFCRGSQLFMTKRYQWRSYWRVVQTYSGVYLCKRTIFWTIRPNPNVCLRFWKLKLTHAANPDTRVSLTSSTSAFYMFEHPHGRSAFYHMPKFSPKIANAEYNLLGISGAVFACSIPCSIQWVTW